MREVGSGFDGRGATLAVAWTPLPKGAAPPSPRDVFHQRRDRDILAQVSLNDIVIVEDDNGMRKALLRMLSAAGFETRSYACAEEFLQAGSNNAGCLVLDLRLPGISGFDLYRKLSESGEAAPVIFITGHDDPAARAEAERLGAVAYLPKPCLANPLVAAVARALATTASRDEIGA